MPQQNFRNHARYVPIWHFITPLLMLTAIAGSIIHFFHTEGKEQYMAGLLVLFSFTIVIIWGYARLFALRAQDRAIRAEENLRHFVLTGRLHDSRLRLGQVIALRFAGDAEMPELAVRAVEEKLSPKQIKMLIGHWRPDYHRV
ncbi:MAG: DUF6526 family protein [Chitinophagaceae bacterium]